MHILLVIEQGFKKKKKININATMQIIGMEPRGVS